MHFMYDNMIALAMATVVFFILASMQLEATQMGIEETSRNAAKNQAQTMATWLERDLAKMGNNMDLGANPIVTHGTESHAYSPSGERTTQFVFSYDSLDADGNEVRVETRYETTEETQLVDGEEKTVYELERAQKDGPESFDPDGGSGPVLRYFDIDMLDADGEVTGVPEDFESIRVRFAVLAPFQDEDTVLREVHRSTTIPYPPAERR